MKKTQAPITIRKSISGRPVIAIPEEMAAPLKEFSREIGMPASRVAQIGIKFMLEKLKDGRASIVNGKFVETPAPAEAA